MPELPEVETHVRDLRRKIVGRRFIDVWTDTQKMIVHPKSIKAFNDQLKGSRIKRIRRRAKHILIDLNDDQTLIVHFRMTGHFLIEPNAKNRKWWQAEADRFTRVAFKLDQGQVLHFSDIRKFGTVSLVPTGKVLKLDQIKRLGVEPLSSKFTWQVLKEILSQKKGKLKPLLLNQEYVVGIGNIYVDESLFDAGLHPEKRISRMKDQDWRKLHSAIQKNLSNGIKHRGTTVGEFMNTAGQPGSHQNYLRVYQQKGRPCRRGRCSGEIKRIVVAQRGTHYCPVCQSK